MNAAPSPDPLPTTADAPETSRDVFADLALLAAQHASRGTFLRAALRRIAAHFASPCAVMEARLGAESIRDCASAPGTDPAPWRTVVDEHLVRTTADARSGARRFADRTSGLRVAVLSTLMVDSGGPFGAIALVAGGADRADAETALAELRALGAFVASLLTSLGGGRRHADPGLLRGVVRGATYRDPHDLAFAIVNAVRNRIECDLVAFASIRQRRARILSISGLDEVRHRSPGTEPMRAAMEECADMAEPLVRQHEDRWQDGASTGGHRLMQRWHEATHGAAVAAVPLAAGGRIVAVIALRRPVGASFTFDELRRIREMVEPLAPALDLVDRASRSLVRHALADVAGAFRWLGHPRGIVRRVGSVAAAAFAFWCAFGTLPYEVTVPCTVRPAAVVHFAAPFEGRIAETFVEPGDAVRAGDPICRMDVSALELEAAQLRAEIRAGEVESSYALSRNDPAESALSAAHRRTIETRLALVEHRIAQAVVRAPADGTILAGDLRPRLGEQVPLGEPLLTMTQGGWRLDLAVPERSIDEVAEGAAGRFALQPRPEIRSALVVRRVHPGATVIGTENAFVAEAEIADAPPWVRAGMEGLARLDAGRRRVWWIALHRVVDELRLRFWT